MRLLILFTEKADFISFWIIPNFYHTKWEGQFFPLDSIS